MKAWLTPDPSDLQFELEDLERHHGPLDITPEEAYDAARAREDRHQDHTPPSDLASSHMTSTRRNTTGAPDPGPHIPLLPSGARPLAGRRSPKE